MVFSPPAKEVAIVVGLTVADDIVLVGCKSPSANVLQVALGEVHLVAAGERKEPELPLHPMSVIKQEADINSGAVRKEF